MDLVSRKRALKHVLAHCVPLMIWRHFNGNPSIFHGEPHPVFCSSQTDIVFLDREIKTRKQAFGIEIYDLMEGLETNEELTVSEKEAKIRAAFDAARKDIAVISAKRECKREEMSVLDAESNAAAAATSSIPPSSGTIMTNQHPSATTPSTT